MYRVSGTGIPIEILLQSSSVGIRNWFIDIVQRCVRDGFDRIEVYQADILVTDSSKTP